MKEMQHDISAMKSKSRLGLLWGLLIIFKLKVFRQKLIKSLNTSYYFLFFTKETIKIPIKIRLTRLKHNCFFLFGIFCQLPLDIIGNVICICDLTDSGEFDYSYLVAFLINTDISNIHLMNCYISLSINLKKS